MAVSGTRSVWYSTSNLFFVASRELADATQWYRIAASNRMIDPWFVGQAHLMVPPRSSTSNGGILGQP